MHRRALSCLAAVLCLCASPAYSVVIDRINVSTVFGYPETYFPGDFNRFGLLGVPFTYELDNGEVRAPGAGWIPYTNGTVSREVVNGTEIEYEFGSITNWARGDGVLFYHLGQVWDYTAESRYWTEGELLPTGPLILTASLGSSVATLSGFARVFFNDPSNQWGDPADFVPYAAPEGALVPFNATYTLLDGATWDLGVFETSFTYQMSGLIEFARAVPEPGMIWLIMLVALAGILQKRIRVV